MNRKASLQDKPSLAAYEALVQLHEDLDRAFLNQFDRSLPLADEVLDRWERARKLGFGEGTSIYDSSYVFGDVSVGSHTWIGPFTIIDGSGGLTIGANCTIAAGVHIYTHDNVGQTLTGGKLPIQREPVSVGDCSYIGPNSVVRRGLTIGKHCLVGANSFVNSSLPDFTVAAGTPAKAIGKVILNGDGYSIDYFK